MDFKGKTFKHRFWRAIGELFNKDKWYQYGIVRQTFSIPPMVKEPLKFTIEAEYCSLVIDLNDFACRIDLLIAYDKLNDTIMISDYYVTTRNRFDALPVFGRE
jgi:hypothetical protein